MYRKTSFVAVFGDNADAIGLDGSTDEHVDVVVAEFAHESHLFHGFATDLTTFRKIQVFDANDCSSVSGHFGEHLIRRHACQTQLWTIKRTVIINRYQLSIHQSLITHRSHNYFMISWQQFQQYVTCINSLPSIYHLFTTAYATFGQTRNWVVLSWKTPQVQLTKI